MTVPFNDLGRRPASEASALRVLRRGWFILGPETKGFEEEFAAFCGVRYCLGTGNGTDALELALRAAGVGPGAEVATVANAGLYSTCAIRAAGAQPLYIDVDPCAALMSPASLENAIGPATRAVIVTHLYGRMAPMPELLRIARSRQLTVIEDCAQAHGAMLDGRRAGSWGTAGCFSFYPTKNLGACGDAGAVVTSDDQLAERARSLRQYGWTAKYDSRAAGGRNTRIDEIQAAILRDRLPLLDGENARRREIARRYSSALAGRAGLIATPPSGGDDWVAHLYVVLCDRRDELRAWLAARGIATDVHYPIPDHRQISQQGLPARCAGLSVTERLAARALSLPCFPELQENEIDAVIAAILEWCPPS
jgi:aminotransferase EvaB